MLSSPSGRGGATELGGIADQTFVAKNAVEVGFANIQVQNATVAIHHRSDGGIESVFRAKFLGQPVGVAIVMHVLGHQNVRHDDFQALRSQKAYGFN